MKRTLLLIVCLALLTSGLSFSQNSPNPTNASTAAETKSDVATQLQQMRTMLQQQQQQIETLKQQLAAQQPTAQHAPSLGEVASTTPVLPTEPKSVDVALPQSMQSSQKEEPSKQATNSINLAQGKLQIGAVMYADWSMYPQTGFGPAFLDTPHTYPGAGNDGFNAFNLNRTYVNFLFSPADWVTFRVTPDVYRNSDGSMALRLKYGYADFHKFFGNGAFKDEYVRFGQQTNPLIDWEEALYGYRFVSLVPWNFISLSSTSTGATLGGPIKGSNGKQYFDYQLGAFNNANFHQVEVAENKTFMARGSVYPMGASSRFEGLGLTGFIDFGYNNKIPSAASAEVVRGAALAHYTSAHNGAQLAFEYDWGRNAMSTGNLFGGSGAPTGPYIGSSDLATAVLGMTDATQRGYDVFGHVNLGATKWAVFGLYQRWQPNTKVANDPFDFDHVVAGLSYTFNKNVRLALDSQDVLYTRSQFTYPTATLATFSPTTAAKYPAGVANAVPPSVKAFFLNMEFTF